MTEIEKIESLRIIPSWKEKFLAISEAKPIGGGIGPIFENKAKTLPFWTRFSLWGLIFGVFFYLFKGMWKKALLIIIITIVLSIIADEADNFFLLFLSYALPIAVTFSHANIDYFRKMVLDEDFWW